MSRGLIKNSFLRSFRKACRSEWQYFYYKRLFATDLDIGYVLQSVKRFKKPEREDYDIRHAFSGITMRADFLLCMLLIGAVEEDYIHHRMYEMTWRDRNKMITMTRLLFLRQYINQEDVLPYLNDKCLFATHWEDIFGRQWSESASSDFGTSKEKFSTAKRIVIKDRHGYGGNSVHIIDTESEQNLNCIYSSLDPGFIVEEYVNQTGWIHDVNPSSVNTIRVATIRRKDRYKVIFAYFRTGRTGSAIDNTHQGGICFYIDVTAGRFLTGYDLKGSLLRKSQVVIKEISDTA